MDKMMKQKSLLKKQIMFFSVIIEHILTANLLFLATFSL